MGNINSHGYVGKTVQLNYDAIRAQSEDKCLFCLSRQQIMALLAIIEPLGWTKRWYSLEDTPIDKDWIEDFYAQLATELMTDHCDLETMLTTINENITTINENIVTINADITTINTNITTVDASLTIIQNTVNIVTTKVDNVYNNLTIINVQNNVILTFGGSTDDNPGDQIFARYNALCTGLLNWMRAEIRAVLTTLAAAPADLAALDLQIDVSFQSVYLQMSSGSSYPYDADTIYAASQDDSAMGDVACYMLTQLLPLVMSYENFTLALTGYSPPAYPDNRYIISQVLTQSLEFLDGFTTLQSILASSYSAQLALAPTSYDCSYCGFPASIDVDFTKGQKWPFLIYFGKSAASLGLQTQITYSQVDGYNVHRIRIELEFPDPITISTIDVGYHWTSDSEGQHGGNFPHIFSEVQYASGGVCPARIPDGHSYANNYTATNDDTVHSANLFTGTYTNPCRLTILVEDFQRAYLTEIHIH